MAIAKLILNSVTQMDVTGTTAVVSEVASGKKYIKADGTEGIGTASFGPAVTIESLSVASNGTYTASSGYAFSPVSVSVPNSYSAADNGKVVANGSLSSQTASTYTSNATYDTTYINSVTVSVSGGGGGDDTLDKLIDRTISGTITANVSTIGPYALTYCSNLEAASFPSATVIGSYALSHDEKLVSISAPLVNTISDYAFYMCSALKEAIFPNCSSIPAYAFGYCTSLSHISFISDVGITVCSSAFYNCTALSILDGMRYNLTSTYAFANTGISEVTYDTFFLCGNANYAFYNCKSLTRVDYSPNMSSTSQTYIAAGMFSSCPSLSFVRILDIGNGSKVTVGANAFNNDIALATVILKTNEHYSGFSGVISGSAFTKCYNLLSLYLLTDAITPLSNVNAFSSTPISTYTTSTGGVYGSIFVMSSLYSSFISATNWSVYSSRFVSLTSEQAQNVVENGTHEL